jgi:hypothetical protein
MLEYWSYATHKKTFILYMYMYMYVCMYVYSHTQQIIYGIGCLSDWKLTSKKPILFHDPEKLQGPVEMQMDHLLEFSSPQS